MLKFLPTARIRPMFVRGVRLLKGSAKGSRSACASLVTTASVYSHRPLKPKIFMGSSGTSRNHSQWPEIQPGSRAARESTINYSCGIREDRNGTGGTRIFTLPARCYAISSMEIGRRTLASIETASPIVEALGVTDYFSIQTYRKAKEYKTAGRMSAVKFLFPNVEMRLDIKTGKNKGINLHLLFSPEDPNHEQEIERILSLLEFEFDDRPYRCTISDLTNLGYAVEPEVTTESAALYAGTNQFKTTLTGA